MTSTPSPSNKPSKRSTAFSVAGSRPTRKTFGNFSATSFGSSSPGSPSATIAAPASSSALRNWSRAAPARASKATRSGSVTGGLQAEHVEDVTHQLVFLVGLAQVTVDADVHRALAVFVAGARGDHDDRHVLQARVALHVL